MRYERPVGLRFESSSEAVSSKHRPDVQRLKIKSKQFGRIIDAAAVKSLRMSAVVPLNRPSRMIGRGMLAGVWQAQLLRAGFR
jgi:hypothetical protein